MTPENQSDTQKPFHESIVDILKGCNDEPVFYWLCKLLVQTKVPKNHDAIIEVVEAGKKRFGEFSPLSGGITVATLVKLRMEKEQQKTSSESV